MRLPYRTYYKDGLREACMHRVINQKSGIYKMRFLPGDIFLQHFCSLGIWSQYVYGKNYFSQLQLNKKNQIVILESTIFFTGKRELEQGEDGRVHGHLLLLRQVTCGP